MQGYRKEWKGPRWPLTHTGTVALVVLVVVLILLLAWWLTP
jgi:hypothetical protein